MRDHVAKDAVVALYERHAPDYDRDRGRSLHERDWLDRFLAYLRPGARVLDVGCGMGEPIARYLIDRGVYVTGIDASPAMIERCRARFPDCEWCVTDMRELDLARQFDGIIAWDSFFHLDMSDQRSMIPRFAAHAAPGAPLLFTSGPAEGESIGSYCGEPLYHASLDAAEYEQLLDDSGFEVRWHVVDDAACGHHTVWLATRTRGATGDDR